MRRASWLHGPAADAGLALCWVPFAVAVVAVQGHGHALAALLSGVLLLSLSHQPVTLALVYGDSDRFRDHRLVYVLGPVVAVVAVAIGLHVSFVAVAVVAGLWNAEHTLMQRYGICRMYGRKAGDDHGPLEKAMLCSWLTLAMVAAAANPRTPRYLAQVNLGEVNRRGISLLTHLRPEATVLAVPVALAAGVLTLRWARAERQPRQVPLPGGHRRAGAHHLHRPGGGLRGLCRRPRHRVLRDRALGERAAGSER